MSSVRLSSREGAKARLGNRETLPLPGRPRSRGEPTYDRSRAVGGLAGLAGKVRLSLSWEATSADGIYTRMYTPVDSPKVLRELRPRRYGERGGELRDTVLGPKAKCPTFPLRPHRVPAPRAGILVASFSVRRFFSLCSILTSHFGPVGNNTDLWRSNSPPENGMRLEGLTKIWEFLEAGHLLIRLGFDQCVRQANDNSKVTVPMVGHVPIVGHFYENLIYSEF